MRMGTLLGVVGVALVAGGLALFGLPSTASAIASQPEALQVLGGFTVLVAGVIAVQLARTDPHSGDELPPGNPLADRGAGWTVDRDLRVIEREDGSEATRARERIRDELRAAVRDAYAEQGVDPETAERRIDAGTWTDDDAVTAFVADGSLPDPGPLESLALRRRGVGRDRWITDRTAVAIAALAERGSDGSTTVDDAGGPAGATGEHDSAESDRRSSTDAEDAIPEGVGS